MVVQLNHRQLVVSNLIFDVKKRPHMRAFLFMDWNYFSGGDIVLFFPRAVRKTKSHLMTSGESSSQK